MDEQLESVRYLLTGAGAFESTASSLSALATFYAAGPLSAAEENTEKALGLTTPSLKERPHWAARLAAAVPAAIALPTPLRCGTAKRLSLFPLGRHASIADKTGRYDLYCVRPMTGGSGGQFVCVQHAGLVEATYGTDPAPEALGATTHCFAKAVTFTTSGLILARTGGIADIEPFQETGGGAGKPSGVEIIDRGPSVGWVIVPALGASGGATAVAMMGGAWD